MSQLSAPVRHTVLACADRVQDALKDATSADPVSMHTTDQAEALLRLTGLVDQLEALRLRVYLANRGVWDAIVGAGPTCSVAATDEDVDAYLAAFAELIGELV